MKDILPRIQIFIFIIQHIDTLPKYGKKTLDVHRERSIKVQQERRLKDRFNEHSRTIDNPYTKSKPTTAAEHFLSFPNHTANDMQLIPIEKIFSNRDSIRKAKEAFLISKGRTLVPHGLNIREETY